MLCLLACFSLTVSAQKRVTGTVLDASGETVIGANVVEKGTTNGISTDADGKFELTVNDNATLVISYIGYLTQEIVTGGRTTFNVILQEDTQALEEVIVIGYGTARKKDFGGSVSSVRLENSPVALMSNMNALEAIKGTVSGLDIGATNKVGSQPSMQLRGQKSISGSNDPLIVVDGVIYMGRLQDINPNDIASLDILKDASSAAAYGSRSANGVISITTKKGKTGKPVVTFNATGGFESWSNRPKEITGAQWLQKEKAARASDDLSWLTSQEVENMNAGKEIDWLDFATRTGLVQDYQAAVSGAGEKMNYYMSASWSDNQGIVYNNDYDRGSLFGKVSADITDWFQVGLDAAYTRSNYNGAVWGSIAYAYSASPYGVAYRDEEQKLLEKYPQQRSVPNPLWDNTNGTYDRLDLQNNFRFNTFAVVSAPWITGLSYRFSYSGNLSKNKKGQFQYETSFVPEGAYDDASRYTPAVYQASLNRANGYIDNNTTSIYVLDNILTYKNTFANKHFVELTAVATRDHYLYEQEIMSGSDFAANGNTALGMYGLHKATTQKIELNGSERANVGYFGRATYIFNNRYLINGSFRRDGASVFGANHKWGNFAAASTAWTISEEAFMKSLQSLNYLKLKLSFGMNGNQGLSPFATLSTVNNGSTGGVRYDFGNNTIVYGITAGALGNSDLGWESTSQWNFGFESAWLNNRLFVDVDYYASRTTNQIFDRTLPVMTGFSSMKATMGEIGNKGLELTMRSVNIETKDLSWTTGITFWISRNKLIHLYGDDVDGDGKEDDDIGSSRFIGKSLGAIYGWVQDGIVQENDEAYISMTGAKPGSPKYKDLDGNGSIDSNDREILGYDRPNFKLNLSNTLTYRDFELYAMFGGIFGGNGWFLKSNTPAFTVGNFNWVPYWTPENKSNVYPSATFSGDGRFLGLQSRTFVRLQDITLSYSLPHSLMNSFKMQRVKLFLTGKNLLTFTGWKLTDPETGVIIGGDDYPVMKTVSAGLNISF
jgi:TonB-linked SusC/RagA family outer membrane protein